MRFAGRRGATGATGATGPRGVNAYDNGNNRDPTTTTTTTATASTTGTHLRLSNTPTVNVTYTENKKLSYRRGTVRCVVSV